MQTHVQDKCNDCLITVCHSSCQFGKNEAFKKKLKNDILSTSSILNTNKVHNQVNRCGLPRGRRTQNMYRQGVSKEKDPLLLDISYFYKFVSYFLKQLFLFLGT